MKLHIANLMAVAGVGLASAAFAGGHEGPGSEVGPPKGWSVGVGTIVNNGIYVGEDTSTLVLPSVRYESDAVSFGVPEGLRVTVLDREPLRFSAVIAPRFNDIGGSSAPELAGLERQQITADGGVQVDYGFGFGTEVSLRAVTELTGQHGGSEIDLGIQQVLPLGRTPIFLGAGAKWQDAALTGFLYGVGTDETAAGRAAYTPGEAITPYLSARTAVPITERINLFAGVEAAFLPQEVTASPIVDQDLAVSGVVGLSFNF